MKVLTHMNMWIGFLLSFCYIPLGIHAVSYIYQNEVIVDGNRQILAVKQNEEPADAVYNFGKKYGLSQDHRSILLKNLCRTLHCNRVQPKIWNTVVNKNNTYIATFELYEGIEPVDAAHNFVLQYNLTLGYRHAILREACEVVECSRLQPIIWEKNVNIGQDVVTITLMEGDEPADVIYHALRGYKLSYHDRNQIMNAVKEDGISHERDQALLFSKDIVVKDEGFNKTLMIFDDGTEPVDAVNEFVENHKVEHIFQQLSDQVLPEICKLTVCTRSVPIIWSYSVTSVEGTHIGFVDVVKNEEPIDAVYRFARTHSLTRNEIDHIQKHLCQKLSCSRHRPVAFTKTVTGENGSNIGKVEILEGEEVVDAVVRFIRKTNIDLDEIAFKNHFFQHACSQRVKCTRNIAHIFDSSVNKEDGSSMGQLTITEQEEPADKVHQFCQDKKLNDVDYEIIMKQVCSKDLVLCKRKMPLVASIPLNDPEGQLIGNFEVQLKEEPVDVLYRFFSIHGLFQKKWDFQAVLNQVCDLPELICTRKRAIKFFAESILMGKTDIGPIVIWEHEEVVDKLFEKRMDLNLTETNQMETFSFICGRKEVYCERTHAKIYELTDITKRDYAKFGNETCERKYAGWQFLESIVKTSIGARARDFIKLKSVEDSIGSPLFSPLILLLMLGTTRIILSQRATKCTIHIGHKIVAYSTVILLVSLSQAIFIEPKGAMDLAMHIYEGRLPDIIILENQEPVDVILRWGKAAAKDHHPIVREPIYWDILDKVCGEIKYVRCKRRRAWEYIDMGSITISDQLHKIDYYNPEVEPNGRNLCELNQRKGNPCIERAANLICKRISPKLSNCESQLFDHMASQLLQYNSKRLESKDTYVKLGLEMDAPDGELHPSMAAVARSMGMNVAPYKAVGNGTQPLYYKWDEKTAKAYAAMDAFNKVRDHESRLWNDKPCTPYFGGALCAKNDKDGNMIIEM